MKFDDFILLFAFLRRCCTKMCNKPLFDSWDEEMIFEKQIGKDVLKLEITHKLPMDLEVKAPNQWIEVPLGDVCARRIRFTLTANGLPWEIPAGAAVLVCYQKADGTAGEYDTLPDGTEAWFAERNMLTVTLAPQISTTPGTVVLYVRILQGESALNTFPVEIRVMALNGNCSCGSDRSAEYFYMTRVLPGPVYGQVGQLLCVSGVDAQGRVVATQAVDAVPGTDGVGVLNIEIMEV